MRFKDHEKFPGDSTAEHSHRLAFITWLIIAKFKLEVDPFLAVITALTHDLPEAIAGDLCASTAHKNPHLKKQKTIREGMALNQISAKAPESIRYEVVRIVDDYRHGRTPEAILVRALDKTESNLSILENPSEEMVGDGFFPIYGNGEIKEALQLFPELRPYFEEIKSRIRSKLKEYGFPWKKKYEF